MPGFGVILSKLLGTLTIPVDYWSVFFKEESLEDTIKKNVLLIIAISICTFIFGFF
jgi:hypothetical protein